MRQPESEASLQADIDHLKDPEPYRERFRSSAARELARAVDILTRLQNAAERDLSPDAFDKLRNAKLYLEDTLRECLRTSDPEAHDHGVESD